MHTEHRFFFRDARDLTNIQAEGIDLVVTSPPYPMIAMWDGLFGRLSAGARQALEQEDGPAAFAAMHEELDPVWRGLYRVLRPGGLACINIGDATRTLQGEFRLYPNHARVLEAVLGLGFTVLPAILWRKQTNAPNKFMGSGVLPAGAYVTLEHEYILILRKGPKRAFITPAEQARRRSSALFWEERNVWFSDVWMDLKGARQNGLDPAVRKRSGAFPFDLAFRLVNMFSIKGDTVLDPFLGTGTTTAAAMTAGRNSVGIEIDPAFQPAIEAQAMRAAGLANRCQEDRLENHREFVRRREEAGVPCRHINVHYGFPVVTRQETELSLDLLAEVRRTGGQAFQVTYDPHHVPAV